MSTKSKSDYYYLTQWMLSPPSPVRVSPLYVIKWEVNNGLEHGSFRIFTDNIDASVKTFKKDHPNRKITNVIPPTDCPKTVWYEKKGLTDDDCK